MTIKNHKQNEISDASESSEQNEETSFARRELEILEKACDTNDGLEMQKEVTKCVMELMDVFGKQGHSGFSASYVVNLFKNLVEGKPLSPLTGDEDEWGEPLDWGRNGAVVQQNRRYSALFRENRDNSTAHCVDDIVFSDNGGVTWFTSGAKAQKYRKPIKFPWMPPKEPRYVYIKYTKEVPAGETCDEFIDITDDENEQRILREKFRSEVDGSCL